MSIYFTLDSMKFITKNYISLYHHLLLLLFAKNSRYINLFFYSLLRKMASSSRDTFEEMIEETFDSTLYEVWNKLSMKNSKIFPLIVASQRRNEPILKETVKTDTTDYGTIIFVKMQHILIIYFDADLE